MKAVHPCNRLCLCYRAISTRRLRPQDTSYASRSHWPTSQHQARHTLCTTLCTGHRCSKRLQRGLLPGGTFGCARPRDLVSVHCCLHGSGAWDTPLPTFRPAPGRAPGCDKPFMGFILVKLSLLNTYLPRVGIGAQDSVLDGPKIG